MTAPAFSNVSADLALAVYLEPHADRRRVLLLGEVEGALAAHLSRFAGHLDIIDPGAPDSDTGGGRSPSARGAPSSRAGERAHSSRGGRGPAPASARDANDDIPELPFDDESFDLVVIADERALPEPRRAALRELRRVTARSGLLAVAGGAPARRRPEARGEASDAPSSELARALRAEFEHVRVFAQAPLLGYVVGDAEAARGAELSIDASLLRGQSERVERLIALASDVRLRLEPRLWVQVPPAQHGQAQAAEPDPRLVESLRKAEDDARRALSREADLLRELERERKARDAGEAAKERGRALERKLLAIEADYDDAVGRIRYLERLVLEREAETKAERERHEQLQGELRATRGDLTELRERLGTADAEREAARADSQAAAQEVADVERRLGDLSSELNDARRDLKRQETIARDLLEELRGLEQRALVAVEHDARVSELEAERERAMQRALDAEVARESAQMRVDELRAQLEPSGHAPAAGQQAELERKLAEAEDELSKLRVRRADETSALYVLRGERNGLRLRLSETEQALSGAEAQARDDGGVLDGRLALAEARAQAAIEALGAAEESLKVLRAGAEQAARAQPDEGERPELEAQLARAERRIDTLERELEEADRFAEDHAEDAERLDAAHRELAESRERLDELEDDVRAAQDELFARKEELRIRDEQLAEARRSLATDTDDRGRTEQALRARDEQLAEARQVIAAHLDERERAEQAARARDEQLAELRQAVAAQQDERERAEQALRARDEQLAEQRQAIAAHLEERERAEHSLRTRDEQLTDLRQTIAAHSLERERTEQALRSREEQLAEARQAIAAYGDERERGEQAQRGREEQLAEARQALAAYGDERERTERALRSLEEQLVEARRTLAAHELEREQAERELHAKDEQLADARHAVGADGHERERLEHELRARDEQLAEARRMLAEREPAEAELATRERERAEAEVGQRLDQLVRRERELRAEVEDGHAALAEARAILSHLAVRVGADTHDLPAIMQALDQQSSPPMLDTLRTALAEAQAARSDSEYQLSRLAREVQLKEERIRELEESLHAPPAQEHNFEPPEV